MCRQIRLTLLLCSLASLLLTRAAAGPLLTTSGGSVYDVNGKQVIFRGIGWWGFNTDFTALEGLRDGTDSVSQDFATVVWRMRVLGFNAVRLPMRFTEFDLSPLIIKHPCQVAPELNVKYTMVPDAFPNLARSNLSIPAEIVPDIPDGWCSSFFLDTTPTRARYINTVKYLVDLGFYVNIDFHSIDPDVSIHNFEGFVSNWTSLVTDVLAAVPEAKGRILLDLINEPDGYKFTWDGAGGSMSLSAYYLALMDALAPSCPDCLFLVEGTGAGNIAANWGDGFVTEPSLVAKGVSDASIFFNQLLSRSYIAQVVLAPHIYCGDVSGSTYATTGPDLWNRLTETFGYLTSSGYGGHIFTALVDEFGSLFDSNIEQQCFHDIVMYMDNAGGAAAYSHQAIQSWFYWSWQPDSYGTGGVTADDYRTIQWFKIDALTGGTAYLSTGLGLCPWYLACYSPVQTLVNPTPPSPDPKLTPVAEPPATPAVACTNGSVSYLGNCTSAVEPAQLYYDAAATQDASLTRKDNIIMYTTIPVGTVVVLAAFAALAALTGCFGAKSAAAKRAVALTPVKAGAYAQGGPIPISVMAAAGR